MHAGRFILMLIVLMVLVPTMGAVFVPETLRDSEPVTQVTYAKPNVIRVLPPVQTPVAPAHYDLVEVPVDPEPSIEINARDAELIAQTLYGEYRGEDKLQQAGVVWCILNRCDYYGESIKAIVTAPNQFHGYSANHPVLPHLYDMAVDVMTRWEREKLGERNVGRVLPSDYLWFGGDGVTNRFRNAYTGGTRWDWSLPNPYEED